MSVTRITTISLAYSFCVLKKNVFYKLQKYYRFGLHIRQVFFIGDVLFKVSVGLCHKAKWMSYVSAINEGNPLVTQYFKACYVDGSNVVQKSGTQYAVRSTQYALIAVF